MAHTATMDIHRHGNCKKRSSGTNLHKIFVIGNINTIATIPSSELGNRKRHRSFEPADRSIRHATTALHTAQQISSNATFDAIRLNASCSTSLVFAYRTFSPGLNPPDTTPE